jgi:apolipoprotein N-acyltransferase
MIGVSPIHWKNLRILALLLFVGALQALSFAPDPLPAWALSPLQLLTMAVLVRSLWNADNGKQGAARAWVFAFGQFMLGLYWLTISMHTYGFIPLPLAILALAALCAYLAVFAGFAGWMTQKIGCVAWSEGAVSPYGPVMAALVWAAFWTLCEWLRATLFTGFPWLNTGYAHADSWFASWAALIGIYGVTFLTAFCAAAIAGLISKTHFSPKHHPQRAVAALLALSVALIGWGLQHIHWSQASGNPLVVRLVQGNVDQGLKFDPTLLGANIQTHLRLASGPAPAGSPIPQVILLPETALAAFQHQIDPAAWLTWKGLATRQASTILMGAAILDRETNHYTNSVIAIDNSTDLAKLLSGTDKARYDKHHLVPFGEFIPVGFRWFVDMMRIPMGDFYRGATIQPSFAINDQLIAANICYEDAFGEELLPALSGQRGATILANFSNLGWFGDSFAIRQHWQMSRMRAIETSRPMLRATNTGASGAIDHLGQPIATLAPHKTAVLDLTIQGQTGLTPYTRVGNLPILLISALVLCIALYRRYANYKNTPK